MPQYPFRSSAMPKRCRRGSDRTAKSASSGVLTHVSKFPLGSNVTSLAPACRSYGVNLALRWRSGWCQQRGSLYASPLPRAPRPVVENSIAYEIKGLMTEAHFDGVSRLMARHSLANSP
jgi:hypothetical protein